jgi:general secretion pathway protein D
VPFLGSIPLLGELFKTRSVDKVKSNLMVFIRPRILRDGMDAAIETNAKYNYLRDQQLGGKNKGKVPLMPRERQPTLPPLEDLVPPELLNPARAAAPAGTTPAERVQGTAPNQGSQNPVESDPAPSTAPTSPFGTQPRPTETVPPPEATPAPTPPPGG